MRMDDATWARHANPWSGWTRVATLPLLTMAIWSRVWTHLWWLAVGILVIWIYVNPRLFPPPQNHDAWMTRGVLGERIWLANRPGTIADHHRRVITATITIASIGTASWLIGLIMLAPTATIAGLVVSILGKLWFVDRMVWIQRDHSPANDRGAPRQIHTRTNP